MVKVLFQSDFINWNETFQIGHILTCLP